MGERLQLLREGVTIYTGVPVGASADQWSGLPKGQESQGSCLMGGGWQARRLPGSWLQKPGGSLCDLIIPKKDNLKDKIEADCKRAKGEQLMKLRPN